jgi:hypothetical protein
MILNFIIGLGAVFALFWIYRTRKPVPSVISIGMIAGIALVLLPGNKLLTAGLSIYIVFVFIAFVYGIFAKGLTIWPRLVICIMPASIMTYWFWRLNHLHGNELLLPIFSLLIGAAALISQAKLKNEAGFLVILAADAVAIIAENLMR